MLKKQEIWFYFPMNGIGILEEPKEEDLLTKLTQADTLIVIIKIAINSQLYSNSTDK